MSKKTQKKFVEIINNEGFQALLKRSAKLVLRDPLRPFDPQYYRRFKYHTYKNKISNQIKFDAPPDPYNTIQIHPKDIDEYVGRRTTGQDDGSLEPVKKKGLARTISGDWDKADHRQSILNNVKIKGLLQHFKGKEWRETELYKYYVDRGYTQDQIDRWFDKIDTLHDDINANGYVEGHEGSHHRDYSQPVRDQLEVLVVIGRDGDIFHFEGNHRFAIARVLDIKIPAHVVCRHTEWQRKRDHTFNQKEYMSKLTNNHPDLQDLSGY